MTKSKLNEEAEPDIDAHTAVLWKDQLLTHGEKLAARRAYIDLKK